MAEKKRSSFILLLEHIHTMEELTDEEFGQFVRAYAAYVETGAEPEFSDRSMRMMWKTVKAFDKMNTQKYSSTSEARQEAGRKGAQKRWNCHDANSKNSNCHNANSKNSLSVSDSVSVSDSESSSSKDDSSYTETRTTKSLMDYFRENIGRLSKTGEKELTDYIERMGADLVYTVMDKCADLGGNSWAYVRKALVEAEGLGCKTVAEYNQLCPIGGSRAKGTRVDRAQSSGNDILSPERMARSRERLRKTKKWVDESC
nr:MAG TPA: DnaD-like replication protein [Bacteriophage sp.]